MLKKTITYEDFNGVEQTEDFYFNLSKTELTELELSVDGGMATWLKTIVATENASEMLNVMKKMILSSVGVKSTDGRHFVKNEEVRQNFVSSPAFDILFMEVATDADKAAQFVKGIIPGEFSQSIDAEIKAAEVSNKTIALAEEYAPSTPE